MQKEWHPPNSDDLLILAVIQRHECPRPVPLQHDYFFHTLTSKYSVQPPVAMLLKTVLDIRYSFRVCQVERVTKIRMLGCDTKLTVLLRGTL